MPKIAIIDYGMGNIHSVKRKTIRLGVDCILTNDADEIRTAEKIIMPGVGHFARAMDSMRNLGLINVLNEEVLQKGKPILGICLGMQLLAKHSAEGDCNGLGWLDANIVRFNISDTFRYKVPHTGWNNVNIMRQSLLMKDIPNGSEFYFVHAYHMITEQKEIILNTTNYEYDFVSAVQSDNIYGVQYHPEKSHDVGAKLIKNFIEL